MNFWKGRCFECYVIATLMLISYMCYRETRNPKKITQSKEYRSSGKDTSLVNTVN